VPEVHVQAWSAVDPIHPGADVLVCKQIQPQAQLGAIADWSEAAWHVVHGEDAYTAHGRRAGGVRAVPGGGPVPRMEGGETGHGRRDLVQ